MVARVVERAMEGVGVCVVASLTITLLALDGVRLRGRTLKLLCEVRCCHRNIYIKLLC